MSQSEVSEAAVLSEDELDRAFAALADPTRRAILARLAEGEAAVAEVDRLSHPRPSRRFPYRAQCRSCSTQRVAQQEPALRSKA